MQAAQKIEILCDKAPAQDNVAPVITAAIGQRLGNWVVTVHERHGGHCWDVRIHPPDGPERHCVFLGEERTAENIRRPVEAVLGTQAPGSARHA